MTLRQVVIGDERRRRRVKRVANSVDRPKSDVKIGHVEPVGPNQNIPKIAINPRIASLRKSRYRANQDAHSDDLKEVSGVLQQTQDLVNKQDDMIDKLKDLATSEDLLFSLDAFSEDRS